MNFSFFKGMLCAGFVVVVGACSDDLGKTTDESTGSISLRASVDHSLGNGVSRAEYFDVESSDLTVRMYDSEGALVKEWENPESIDSSEKIKVGQYTVEAFYGSEKEGEGFESPYFYSSTSVLVEENVVTPVVMSVGLANAMVDVDYTDDFKDYMVDYGAKVVCGRGTVVAYPKETSSVVYTMPGTVNVIVDFVKANGVGATVTAASFAAEAKNLYHVTIDVENKSGNAVLKVIFDGGLSGETVEEIDISDEMLAAPAPEIFTVGFENEGMIEVISGNPYTDDLRFNVFAQGGIKNVWLSTVSTSLINQGWSEKVDLVADDLSQMKALGLDARGFDDVDKIATISLKDVIKNIRYVPGDSNETVFTLNVTDRYGKTQPEPMVLKVNVLPVDLSIVDVEYYQAETIIEFKLSYTGNDINELKIKYFFPLTQHHNNLTAWEVMGVEGNVYTIRGEVQPFTETSNLIVTLDDETNAERDFVPRAMVLHNEGAAVNSFATNAYLPVTVAEGANIRDTQIYVSKDGTTYSRVASTAIETDRLIKITGLESGTTYSVKIQNGSRPLEWTLSREMSTERALALTNGDMESWSSTKKTSGAASCNVFDCEGWATLNTKTTSALTMGSSYSALSSTIPTDDSVNGQAALIRTVGYGNSTNAAGTNEAKQWSHGELFLGEYNGDTSYGIEFGSRPAGLKFSYKYTPYNSADKGYAEIAVLDASNLVISVQSVSLEATTNYTEKELSLGYDGKDLRNAAHLRVIFRSTYDPSSFVGSDFVKKTTNWIGLLTDYYLGSALYVDNITLTY